MQTENCDLNDFWQMTVRYATFTAAIKIVEKLHFFESLNNLKKPYLKQIKTGYFIIVRCKNKLFIVKDQEPIL